MTNQYLKDFRTQMRNRFAEDSEQMSYSDWIIANTTLRKKPFSFAGYEFQKQIVDDMHPSMYVIKCSQIGLALDLETPVPTATGWTTMGEIQVGEQLFDEKGQPCTVTYVSPVYTDRDCYEITFCDGEKIIADGSHRWYVEGRRKFDENGLNRTDGAYSGIIRTEALFKQTQCGKYYLYQIPTAASLQLPEADLLVDPYFLGVWLGDGSLKTPTIACSDADVSQMQENIRARGFTTRQYAGLNDNCSFYVTNPTGEKLTVQLRTLGLLCQRKFIPREYLRASHQDRLDLLSGLIDTDGSVDKNGRVSFFNSNPELFKDVLELVRSLGYKPVTHCRDRGSYVTPKGVQINAQPQYQLNFMAFREDGLCKLPRKHERLKSRTQKGVQKGTLARRIIDVRKVDPIPTRCLTVDSPSHLFLCGKGMIPTHNTETQLRKFAAFGKRNVGVKGIFTLPDDNMFKRVSQTRFKPMIDSDHVFNLGAGDKPIRSIPLYQIDQSFLYFVGGKETDATSIDADLLFHDELDLSNQEMIALFQSRLQGSDWRITQNFSTPTYEGFGIDAGFRISDQHEYLCKCTKCSHHNIPAYTPDFVVFPGLSSDINDLIEIDDAMAEKIDLDAAYMRCEKCGHPLDLKDPALRSWVSRFPGRRTRGYRVTPFCTPRLTLPYILSQQLQYKRSDATRRFYNTVLGESFNDSNARLSELEIRAVMGGSSEPSVDKAVPCLIGIDVGLTCHVTLYRLDGNRPVAFSWRQVVADTLYDEVEKLLSLYNVVGGLMDRNPYTTLANEIRDLSQGRILPAEYALPTAAAITFVKDELDQLSHVKINRTTAIDMFASALRKRKMGIEGFGRFEGMLIQHLRDMVRVEKEDQSAVWQKLTGEDHFFHSGVLGLFASRVHEALLYRADFEARMLVGAQNIMLAMGGDQLGIQSRRKASMPLGQI